MSGGQLEILICPDEMLPRSVSGFCLFSFFVFLVLVFSWDNLWGTLLLHQTRSWVDPGNAPAALWCGRGPSGPQGAPRADWARPRSPAKPEDGGQSQPTGLAQRLKANHSEGSSCTTPAVLLRRPELPTFKKLPLFGNRQQEWRGQSQQQLMFGRTARLVLAAHPVY